ncbi:hypothetical protein L227DRAFT_484742, partial [Lentinus tigrinus ALCF2SS1-6]
MYNLVIGTKCPHRPTSTPPTLDCTGRQHAWDTIDQEHVHRRRDPEDNAWYWDSCEQNPCPNRHDRPDRINQQAYSDEFIPVPDSPAAESPTTHSPLPSTPSDELEVAALIALPPSPLIIPSRPLSAPPVMTHQPQQGAPNPTAAPPANPQVAQPAQAQQPAQAAQAAPAQPPDPTQLLLQSMTLLTQSMTQLAAATATTSSGKAVQKPAPFKGEQGGEARRFLAAFTINTSYASLNHVDAAGNALGPRNDQWIRTVLSYM